MSKKKEIKKGRPDGSLTRSVTNVVELSACPKCKSTLRTSYSGCRTLDMNGEHNGQKYTKITWRNTKCQNCGQIRVDKSYS